MDHHSKNYDNILESVPSNRGYMINGSKFFGHSNPLNDNKNVSLIEYNNENKNVHVWLKNGYINIETPRETRDDDCWQLNISSKKKISCNKMVPCPNEMINNGTCWCRLDKNHRKTTYHFSRTSGGVTKYFDGKPICKYNKHGKKQCWEHDNEEHCSVYHHF